MKNIKITSLLPGLIDTDNELFSISRGRKLSESEKISIQNGIIRPIFVIKKEIGYLLISGRRRFEAWKKYRGTEKIPVYQIGNETSQHKILKFIVDDLRIESELNPFEISAVFNVAMKMPNFDRQYWWEFLRVKSSVEWFKKIQQLAEMPNLIQNFLIQKVAPIKKCLLFTKLNDDNLSQIEQIVSLFPGLNVLCEFAEMLFEIGQKTDVKQISEITAILETDSESKEKIKQIRDVLHTIRYPIWSKNLQKVGDLVSSLENQAEIRWDRTFEKSGVEILAKIQNLDDWENWQNFFLNPNNREIFKKIVEKM